MKKIFNFDKQDTYGEIRALKKFVKVRTYGRKINFIIQHGWIPSFLDCDAEAIIGNSGDAHLRDTDNYIVATENQRKKLIESGLIKCNSIGHSILYLENIDKIKPRENSIIFVPGHSTFENSEKYKISEQYLDFIEVQRKYFDKVGILIYGIDFERRYVKMLKNRIGDIEIYRGAKPGDKKSLDKVNKILNNFEFMNSDNVGTHLPFALFLGLKVSLFFENEIESRNNFYKDKRNYRFYRNSPISIENHYKFLVHTRESSDYSFLRKLPQDSEPNYEWAFKELGYDQKLSKEEMLVFLQDFYYTQFFDSILQRIYNYITKLINKAYLTVKIILAFGIKKNLKNYIKLILNIKTNLISEVYAREISRSLLFRVNSSDFANIRQHFVERELFGIPWKDYTSYFDVGSYCGYSIAAARYFNPNLKIYGLEPNVESFKILQKNHFQDVNVKVENTALWTHDKGVRILEVTDEEWAWQVREIEPIQDPQTSSITFETLLKRWNIDSFDLLKLDIEGAEAEVLEHSGEIIFGKCRNVLLEIHDWLPKVEERVSTTLNELRKKFYFEESKHGEFIFFQNIRIK